MPSPRRRAPWRAPDRLLRLPRRVGAQGEGRFERTGCDKALDEIAERRRTYAAG